MKRIRYIFFVWGLLSFASCSQEYDDGEKNGMSENGKTIVFTLSNASPAATTRAANELLDNEKRINRLDVFFYDADGETCLFYPTASQFGWDDTKVTITIPESMYREKLLGKTSRIFVMANGYLERSELEGKTLDQLKKLAITNGEGRRFNLETPPVDFLMTGESEPIAIDDTKSQRLGEIVLKRLAAKIVVDISQATIAGYTPGEARVRLTNYLDKTILDGEASETYESADYKTVERTLTANDDPLHSFSMDRANAFYTYANDWNREIGRESYITLEVDWTADGERTPKTYYYRIPFSYIEADGSAGDHTNRIRRNFVYRFVVNVSDLGGLDPRDAMDLEANFTLQDWREESVEVEILRYHYLYVYNAQVQTDRASYEWEYRSSLPIDWEVTKVQCTEYASDGTSRPIDYVKSAPQYPEVTLRDAAGKNFIGIRSVVPTNYVPLHIVVTLRNEANLSADIVFTILPREYVTATYSEGGSTHRVYPDAGAYNSSTGNGGNGSWGSNTPDGENNNVNFNFYQITTTSLEPREILVGGVRRRIMIGDPTRVVEHPFNDIGAYRQTDPELNHIVSPAFVVASQRGMTSPISWARAQERCMRYRESQYPAGTWRVPTFAELAMLGDMQNDDNSAIKGLFVSGNNTTGWWTALQPYSIRVDRYRYDSNAGVIGINPHNASVRCVHDTWRDAN